jgi:LmbE family N-acetylglucosaminyl deacetylase
MSLAVRRTTFDVQRSTFYVGRSGFSFHYRKSMNIQTLFSGPRPVLLSSCSIPHDIRLLVLAPHPDDFDEIAITLRVFRDNGNPIHVAVLSSGASGVEDSFCALPAAESKAKIREQEQRRSCRFFGLRDTYLDFLRLREDHDGHILECPENYEQIRRCVYGIRPAIVLLPHGNDTNADHRRACTMFMRIASEAEFSLAALLNKDPKTIRMRYDLYTAFGPADAEWKATLLRFHTSQQQRNLNTRCIGFDERILEINRQIALECPGKQEFAEAFECAFWE